jgi:hypothetical protein
MSENGTAMRGLKTAIAAFLLLGLSPAFAAWESEISAYDRERLNQFDTARAQGLAQADNASPADRSAVRSVLDPQSRSISSGALVGTWRCRTMKLGGLTPAIVYTWFTCRVRNTGNGLYFEKLNGSQRLSGYLDPYNGGSYVLLASSTVGTERQKPYSGGGASAGAMAISSDMVGLVSSIGPGRARIEFPYPVLESTFDVIELRR